MNSFEQCMESIIKDFKFLPNDSIYTIDKIRFSKKFNIDKVRSEDDESPSLFLFYKHNLYLNNYYLSIPVQNMIKKNPHLILYNVRNYLIKKYDFTVFDGELFKYKLYFNYPPENLKNGYGINLFI